MLEKNQQYTAVITDITFEGNGICHIEGMAVFVPNTAVGDEIRLKIVKVLKSYAFGIVEELLTPSEERIDSDCDCFNKCGGCIFRHINYKSECKIKSDIVKNAFTRIGGFNVDFEQFEGCTEIERYRNKAQYPIAVVDGKAVCGFYAPRSHRVIPIADCKLQPTIFSEIVEVILDYINEKNISIYDEKKCNGTARHIYIRQGYHTKEIMVCLVVCNDISAKLEELAARLTARFSSIKSIVMNINRNNTNVILGKKCVTIWGNNNIADMMCGNKIEISPLSFYQVNTEQAEKLYNIALEYAAPEKTSTVIDLYCGAGTIGLSMAAAAKQVLGVEIIHDAVRNAKRNAFNNKIKNAEFICGDAGEVFSKLDLENSSDSIIVLDPPRKGCELSTLEAVIKAAPDKIVMISCNPSTAARDCKLLSENGYALLKVKGVDMFPRTGHVETVVLLSKLRSEHHIDVELHTDELDLTSAESKATYDEIKAYVKEHTGLTVSSLNIAQVKKKCGIIERENYNKPKSDTKQPKCPKDKEEAIVAALKGFGMVE